jgi:FtsP/CotA-like multicopper oxidase with cupredoxin domain
VLEVDFEVADRKTTIAGRTVEGQSYADGVQGPTLRLAPGERLRVHLRNRLDQETNLHFHGMHVSPVPPGDDVLMHVAAGKDFTYDIEVPADHARGTYWYHSHQHGTSEAQVFAGLSGVLIVEGLEDLLPEPLRQVPQRVLAFKDVQVVGDEVEEKDIDSNAPTTRLVNGLERPGLTAAPGETQLWRLANIGADIFYDVQLSGVPFTVVGEDGNPVWSVWAADHLVLPPGKRYDVLVQATAGSATLSTLAYDQGGDQYPAVPLATLDPSGPPVAPAALPTSLIADPDLATARIDKARTIEFDGSDDDGWRIDGKEFDMSRVDQLVQLGTTEEWTVRNTSAEQHPFHIHQDDFQVMSVNGQAYGARSEQDTVVIPIGGEVVIRMAFRDFPGRWVFHCHILAHEDAGMMAIVGAEGPDGRIPGDPQDDGRSDT